MGLGEQQGKKGEERIDKSRMELKEKEGRMLCKSGWELVGDLGNMLCKMAWGSVRDQTQNVLCMVG